MSQKVYSAFKTSAHAVVLSYSGIYNWLYTVGFSSVNEIYNFVIQLELLAVISILLAKLHLQMNEELLLGLKNYTSITSLISAIPMANGYYHSSGARLNYHTGVLVGFTSILWFCHFHYHAIPVARQHATPNILASLTFLGGLKSDTQSLYLTDIAHHHLACGVLFVWAGHLYSSSLKAFGHRMRDVLFISTTTLPAQSTGSANQSLALALASCSVITSVVAQHIYSLKPYFDLSYDLCASVACWVHHSWIAGFLMVASSAHFAISFISDSAGLCQPIVARILAHKSALLSSLSGCCLWLGFHTLAVYSHNDTVVAFGEPEKQILIEPTNAQIIQQSSGKALYFGSNAVGGSGLTDINKSFGSLLLPLGPGDMYVHHAIALGLHVSVLVLSKGALHATGSNLMPDKMDQHYAHPCDGPARGGTCDISAWDSFYLAMFWMLNTIGWTIFYFHWKNLTLWENTPAAFDQSSTYLNAWFRDYLWSHSAPLIRGYDAFGINDLSVSAWAFLGAHLCWATGFMFLISWRGYWQELIDIILYMHLKTPILYDLWNGGVYTPVALSIVQARFVGLVHFSTGFILTYLPFLTSATS
eukprot:TRINITY_DN12026_c0_g1_i4.p1 TRINITY_DN12026_c0_g1~~TRINITY_DN12026_c0_g1_i4.p1  ORF type:complete len:588 (+),score=-69.61 TRINITY_DN12026_c0_g1_i4:422-2185(+)